MNDAVSGPNVLLQLVACHLPIVGVIAALGSLATPVIAQPTSPVHTESDELRALDETEGVEFGGALAISGEFAIIGVSGIHPHPGAAYLFRQSLPGSGTWIQCNQLFPEGHELIRKFGRSVAIDGDTAVVGSNETASGVEFAGSVYIYERNAGGSDNWGLVKRLTASSPAHAAGFGGSVALVDDTLFISEPFRGPIQTNAGVVYVHERDAGGPGNWGEVYTLSPAVPIAGNLFGLSLAAGPETLVVGNVPLEIFSSGSAHVFERNAGGNGWSEVQVLTGSDPASGDDFGFSAVLDRATLVVGARNARNESRQRVGAAYIFGRESEQGPWIELQKLFASDPRILGSYGASVALKGDFLVVGSPRATLDGAGGIAYVLERVNGPDGWAEIAALIASDGALTDRLGAAVAMTGGVIMLGAPFHDHTHDNAGAVYVYDGPDEPPIEVEIDIKPDSYPNSVNPRSRGAIPVAILGSTSFDVANIDEATLRLGPDAAPIAHRHAHFEDVNLDGIMDLLTHFRTRDTGIGCGDESATLTGETSGGQAFEGTDSIQTVGCREGRRPAIWTMHQ